MDGILVHGHFQIWSAKTGMSKSKAAFIETVVRKKEIRLQLYLNNGKVKSVPLKNNIKSVFLRSYQKDQNYLHLTFQNNDFLFIEKLVSEDAKLLKTFLDIVHQNNLQLLHKAPVERSIRTQEFHDTSPQSVCKTASSEATQENETSVPQKIPLSASESSNVTSAKEQTGKRKRIISPHVEKYENEGVLKENCKESEAEPTTSVKESGEKQRELTMSETSKPASVKESEEKQTELTMSETSKPAFELSFMTKSTTPLPCDNDDLQVFIGNLLSAFLLKPDFIEKGMEWHEYLKTILLYPDKTWQGLPNVGNTCYVNAVLQSLFSVPQFANDLFNQGFPWIKPPRDEFNMRLMQMLVLKDTYNIETREMVLMGIQKALPEFGEIFAADKQNDAHEFLSLCLVQLKETIKTLNVIWQSECESAGNRLFKQILLDNAAKEAPVCPVASNFDFELLNSIFCKACDMAIIKTEPGSCLSIDIPPKMRAHTFSIQSSLDYFFKMEELEHTCETCQHNRSLVVRNFSRLPRVIIIHLKRYSFTESRLMKKDEQNVVISKYLNLSSHCNTNTQPPHPLGKNAHVKDTGLLKPLEDLGSEIIKLSPSSLLTSRSKIFPTANIGSKLSNRDSNAPSEKLQSSDLGKRSSRTLRMSGLKKAACRMRVRYFKKKEKPYTYRELDSVRASDTTKDKRYRISERCHVPKHAQSYLVSLSNEQIPQQAIAQSLTKPDAQMQTENIKSPAESDSESANLNNQSSLDPIKMPEDKDVSDTSKSKAKEEPKAVPGVGEHTYRLIDIISHLGNSPHSGHYINDSYDLKKQEWFTYSDLHVEHIKEDCMLESRLSTGYVFFYMHNEIFEELLAREKKAQSSREAKEE